MSAQQMLDLYKELLPGISASEASAAFKKNFAPGTFAYVITSTEKAASPAPSREQVMAVVRKANAVKVEKLPDEAIRTNLLAKLPEPGKVVEKTETDKDLGITSAWLENGVRFHHRFTRFA